MYALQVKVNGVWENVRAMGSPTFYTYTTRTEAEYMLRICYPNQVRRGKKCVRVVEVR